MAFFSRQFSPSPVLTVPAQSPHQGPFGMAGFPRPPAPASTSFGGFSNSLAPFQTSTSTSRKRSRDEAASNLEPDIVPPKPEEPEEVWEYGPGMTLIKSTKTYVAEAGSQSGTWLEEKKASEDQARIQAELDRKQLAPRSSKLQRVVVSNSHDSQSLSTASPASVRHVAAQATVGDSKTPIIDNFTLHLGIGWRQLSKDEHIQAAARGWARYIENHYPITNAHVRLESRGLQSYLVESSEGFFLFSEDLRRGQLVSTTVEGALKNLGTSPPTFDGCITLSAADSPSPTSTEARHLPSAMDAEMVMN
ncbi:unnamed protein product [Clonostachys rosea]|uniref:Uncharacterized protein n=1 Tax=Bionectria ochroleuca TaxID=29856 RepID=A0ABY6TMX6_BIOOC|nr:unnamed protein product [Clonostachys rosea]